MHHYMIHVYEGIAPLLLDAIHVVEGEVIEFKHIDFYGKTDVPWPAYRVLVKVIEKHRTTFLAYLREGVSNL